MRRVVEGGTNNLLHLHTDHLGSNSVMSYNNGGGMVSGSRARYLPFGSYRTAPSQTFTDRGYTGQKHNDNLGLIYYNARYYLPGVARFVSADTIVPDAANPQAFNRFSYVLNNPLAFVDSTGHCTENGDEACWSLVESICEMYCEEWQDKVGDWWNQIYLGRLTYRELIDLERRINPENWVTTPAGDRFWVGQGTNPLLGTTQYEPYEGDYPPVWVEDSPWEWELGAGPIKLELGDEANLLLESRWGLCIVICLPLNYEAGETTAAGGGIKSETSVPVAVGMELKMGVIDLGFSTGAKYSLGEKLITNQGEQINESSGWDFYFEVSLIFNAELKRGHD